MADIIFHVFVNYAITKNWVITISVFIPDLLYVLAFFISLFHQENIFWEFGALTHSLFILPPILLLMSLINPFFSLVLIGVLLHIMLDMLTHTKKPAKYFYPLIKDARPVGFIQWEDHPFLTIVGAVCLTIILIMETVI